MSLEDDLDHTPLTFGKHKGKTPDQISEEKDGENYIVWMFETVENRPTCSRLLYEACGGKPLKPIAPPAQRDRSGYFDDMDDDIPF